MLRKLLLAILLISCSANADIKFNMDTNEFYSVPAHKSIDQIEYNRLAFVVSVMGLQCWNHGVYGKARYNQQLAYLATLKSPTSQRLLADLKKGN